MGDAGIHNHTNQIVYRSIFSIGYIMETNDIIAIIVAATGIVTTLVLEEIRLFNLRDEMVARIQESETEITHLKSLISSLADRIAGQSEILSRLAEEKYRV